MKNGFVFLFSFFTFFVYSQKSILLSDELKEISGIQFINDSLLVAHNDGGNGPMLYFLNPNTGSILKRVVVKDVKIPIGKILLWTGNTFILVISETMKTSERTFQLFVFPGRTLWLKTQLTLSL